MRWFDYLAPQGLEEVVDIFAEKGDRAKALAGGTDLILFMEQGRVRPDWVVEIPTVSPFIGIGQRDGQVRLGSRVTMRELEASFLIRQIFPALSAAAGEVGSVQIRNLATIGGNICTASPAGDTLPVLLVLNASVKLCRKGDERLIPLTEFFVGPGKTIMEPDEVLTEIFLPVPEGHVGMSFYKLAVRRYMDIATVNVAAFVRVNRDGLITDARLALGSVAPKPIRAYEAEERLKGNPLNDRLLDEAAKLAQGATSPISDQRGSAAYKRIMAYRLTKRVVSWAYREATQKLSPDK